MVKLRNPATIQNIFLVIAIAVVAVFLLGKLTTGLGTDTAEFVSPTTEQLGSIMLWIIKFALIAVVAYLGTRIILRFGTGKMTRREWFTVIFLGIGIYAVIVYVLPAIGILDATTLEDISFAVGQKLGLM